VPHMRRKVGGAFCFDIPVRSLVDFSPRVTYNLTRQTKKAELGLALRPTPLGSPVVLSCEESDRPVSSGTRPSRCFPTMLLPKLFHFAMRASQCKIMVETTCLQEASNAR
jgi:hypothetical protein